MRDSQGARAPRRATSLLPIAGAAFAVALCVGDARAAAPQDVAVAEALFREARELVAAGKAGEACPKFAESQRLDPAPGTLLNLGDCYERTGLYASAWGAYQEAEQLARRGGANEQASNAAALARDVESKVPQLVIRVDAANDFPDLSVTRSGTPVPRGQWGAPIPVDPGAYVIEAAGKGHKAYSVKVEIAAPPSKPRTTTVDIPRLPAEEIASPVPAKEVPRDSATSSQKTFGIAVGAAGLATLVAGTVVGLLALDRDGAARDEGCNDSVCYTKRGRELTVEARGLATASTWLFVAGAAVTVGGVVLFVSAPSTPANASAGPASGFFVGTSARW